MASPSGAFTLESSSIYYESSLNTGSSEGWAIHQMNSARSSSIYQSGGTIRPVSRQVRFIIKY